MSRRPAAALAKSILADLKSDTTRAEAAITNLLRDRHHITGADDDFFIRNLTELANSQQEGTKTMTTLAMPMTATAET